MDARYESFCFADPYFYDSPERWQRAASEFDSAPGATPGWRREERGVWTVLMPDGAVLPAQGWKIHVSATLANAERLLARVAAYCLGHALPFKFLRGPAVLLMQNSKYAARGSSGKLLTLYPRDDAQLERALTDLDGLIGGEPGPYILSDLRWNAGPLYTRYGAFAEMYHVSGDGVRELAVRRPDGATQADRRGPVFSVPDWVELPAFLEPHRAARAAQRLDLPYTIERVLHFSNGGGIYLGRDAQGRQVVLKEARPHAGLDQGGTDAVERLSHEYRVLSLLQGLAPVPEVVEYATAWEHHFLVERYVPGETLDTQFVQRYPLVRADQDAQSRARYAEWALDLVGRVERGLRAIHGQGIVFGDLHPNNIMVRPDGAVVFLDFELASPEAGFRPPMLGAGGFAAPRDRTGFDVDRYALASLKLWLMTPLVAMLQLDRDKVDHLIGAAHEHFPLPPAFFDDTREYLRRPGSGRAAPAAHVGELLDPRGPHDWPALRAAIAGGIAAAATPERADRLFPGDVNQFTYGGHGLAYGAAGVLYALHATGAPVPEAHTRWLVEASRRDPVAPGALTGSHGTAYVLDLLGHRDEALRLLERLDKAELNAAALDGSVANLANGLAGVGLVSAHFAAATGDPHWNTAALDAAARIADRLAAPPAPRGERMGEAREGLVYGASGVALFAVRLYEHTGDGALLDLAETALRRDLEACRLQPDGTLQVLDGGRVLPYIETGSTGIGLALREYLAHRPHSPLGEHEPAIARACGTEFVIQSGLFNGRAGLVAYLARLRDAGTDTGESLDRHVRRLFWHAVSHEGNLAFPGDQILRLSSDLATGSAGVLLALGAALGTGAPPFFPACASRPGTADRVPASGGATPRTPAAATA